MADENLSQDVANGSSSKTDNKRWKNGGSDKKDVVSVASTRSDTLPTPPDGGYGWVIVMAAFICNMITDGTAFSFGILFDELLDYFKESKSKTSLVGSIFMGVPLLASPIASALINKYGCRAVSMAGGLLATVGFVLSYFANSIEFLCFSFGLVSGVGLSMVYTPAVVIVAFYFEKRRALATGLSVAGSGIGTLAFAPLVEFLTVNFGWRGTILILAGLMLNTCVFGALFRPLTNEPTLEPEEKPKEKSQTAAVYDKHSGSAHIAKIRELYSDPFAHSLIQFPTYLTEEEEGDKHDQTVDMTASNHELSLSNSRAHSDMSHDLPSNHCLETHLISNGNHNDFDRGDSLLVNTKCRTQTSISDTPHTKSSNVVDRLHPLYRRDIFYKGSLLMIPQFRAPIRGPSRVSSCPDLYIKDTTSDGGSDVSTDCCQWKHVKRVVREMLDVSIFRQPLYSLFFISNFLLYAWYDIPYFYLPNSATSKGLGNDEASLIISVIGIGNTVGQVAFGLIADYTRLNNSFVYGFGIAMCGISILFIPLCETMATLCMVGSLFGLFIGANYALCSIIIVDLLSLEKLTNAYGIMLCGQGVANLLGPPLGGLLFDYTHSYVATYETAGALITLSGIIMLAVALHQCRKPPPDVALKPPSAEVLDPLTRAIV